MPQTQREPIPYTPRKVEIVQEPPRTERIINLGDQVRELQSLSTIPVGTWMRRLIFIWLRIYVNERKRGKEEKVNIKIPIPIPIVGAALARQLSFQKAAKIAQESRRGADVTELLESTMGFEFVRVEDDHSERDKKSIVVIGFD